MSHLEEEGQVEQHEQGGSILARHHAQVEVERQVGCLTLRRKARLSSMSRGAI